MHDNARPPLVLMAAKSWVGHGEPAAGAVGILHAHEAVSKGISKLMLPTNLMKRTACNVLTQKSALICIVEGLMRILMF